MNNFTLHFIPALVLVFFSAVPDVYAEKGKQPFFHFINFYTELGLSVPFDDIETARNNFILNSETSSGKKSGYECNTIYEALGMCPVKTAEGVHMSLRGIDFKAYSKMPYVQLSQFSDAYAEDGAQSVFTTIYSKTENPVYGFSVKAKEVCNEGPPLSLYSGSLSFSRSISLLKSPQLPSMTNALKTNFGRLTGIAPALPSFSSSAKPFATAVVFSPEPFTFECACSDNSTFLFSCSARFLYKNFLKAQGTLSGGRFFLEESSESSWFCTKKRFSSGWYDAYALETLISIPRIKNQLSAGCHRNPFGNVRFWFRNETRIVLGAFLCDTAFFAADNYLFSDESEGIITADSGILTTAAQAKINPQFRHYFSSPKIQLCIGITGAAEIKRQAVLHPEETTELQGGSAISLSAAKTSAELSFKISGITYAASQENAEIEPKYTASLQCSYAFSSWKAAAKTSFSSTQADNKNEQTESCALYAYFPTHLISAVSARASWTQKKASESRQVQTAVTLAHNTGKIRFRGKIALEMQW